MGAALHLTGWQIVPLQSALSKAADIPVVMASSVAFFMMLTQSLEGSKLAAGIFFFMSRTCRQTSPRPLRLQNFEWPQPLCLLQTPLFNRQATVQRENGASTTWRRANSGVLVRLAGVAIQISLID
jgi:hypothetical protein